MDKYIEIIDPVIKNKLATKNLYRIFNHLIFPLLSEHERAYLEELQKFLLQEVEPKIDLSKEVYPLFPILGSKNYMQRLNKADSSEYYGMRYELLLAMCTSILDPELDLARVVSGLIFTNPLFNYGKTDRMQQILAEVLSGKKTSGICITERKQGSDAVNMKTTVSDHSDYIILNGEKVYTTNGPVADYLIAYGVTEPSHPRDTMYQSIVERGFPGFETYRLGIPSVPRVEIGQTIFKNVKIPYSNILGAKGKGYRNLFYGLTAERDSIIGSSLGNCWLALITALIYTSIREQFNTQIYNFQAVSFPITELFSELMAATSLGLTTGTEYHKATRHPSERMWRYAAAFSSGTKSLCARLSHHITHEAQLLCGGIGYTNNIRVERAVQVSGIQEVIGGTRNIQLFLSSKVLRDAVGLID